MNFIDFFSSNNRITPRTVMINDQQYEICSWWHMESLYLLISSSYLAAHHHHLSWHIYFFPSPFQHFILFLLYDRYQKRREKHFKPHQQVNFYHDIREVFFLLSRSKRQEFFPLARRNDLFTGQKEFFVIFIICCLFVL